jgi:hypothetical protein
MGISDANQAAMNRLRRSAALPVRSNAATAEILVQARADVNGVKERSIRMHATRAGKLWRPRTTGGTSKPAFEERLARAQSVEPEEDTRMSDATMQKQQAILKNQTAIMKNQSAILANQKAILGDVKRVLANQKRILANQARILKK